MPNPSIKDETLYQTLRDKGMSAEKAARISNAKANPDMHPSEKGGKSAKYEDWTRDALYDRARELGLKGLSKKTKAQIIDALRNH